MQSPSVWKTVIMTIQLDLVKSPKKIRTLVWSGLVCIMLSIISISTNTAQAQSEPLSETDLLALPIVRCDLFSCLAPEN